MIPNGDWSLLRYLYKAYRIRRLLGEYVPSKVTVSSVLSWLSQFPKETRGPLIKLLSSARFYGENAVVKSLVDGHRRILERLERDNLGIQNIIYVQHDDAGSSSGVMLNLLRDAAQLQHHNAILVDAKNRDQISRQTDRLGYGAIVYVDDFAATGDQFLRNRDETSQYVVGSFSEFFLSVAICEEAVAEMHLSQVVPIAAVVHKRVDRPLHDESNVMSAEERALLVKLGSELFQDGALGYGGLATSLVFYRNAPDSTPLLLRGHKGQSRCRGVIPRTTDLAIRV